MAAVDEFMIKEGELLQSAEETNTCGKALVAFLDIVRSFETHGVSDIFEIA
jgi:hypothetical protein